VPDATYQQNSFLGGEWSPFYQGRADSPKYRTALNVCRNIIPLEEGAAVRRPGSRLKAPTYQNKPAKIFAVEFTASEPYDAEFTDGWLRFFQGNTLVYTTDGPQAVTSISTASPAVMLMTSAVTWLTGDEIYFTFDAAHPSGALPLRQRSFTVTKTDTTHFTLTDTLTGANIDGSTLAIASGTVITASRVLRIATPYVNGSWAVNRIVQNQDMGVVLNGAYQPRQLTIAQGTLAGTATAALVPITMLDGPYLDPVVDSSNVGSILTWYGGTVSGPALVDAITYGGGTAIGGIVATIPTEKSQPNSGTDPTPVATEISFYTYTGISSVNEGSNPVNGTGPALALPIIDEYGWIPVDPTGVGSQATGTITIVAQFQKWLATTYYLENNCVTHSGTSYQALGPSVAIEPGVTSGWATSWVAIDSGVAVTGLGKSPVGFQTTDVGRMVRMLSAPADWDAQKHYAYGNIVQYDGSAYVHTGERWLSYTSTGIVPTKFTAPTWGQNLIDAYDGSQTGTPDETASTATIHQGWSPVENASNWVWGRITSVTNSNTAVVTIDPGSAPMLYPLSDFQINTWRMGAFCDTLGWPKSGSFYEGRFWFGGCVPNRFDTSQSFGWIPGNPVLNMAPTALSGDVLSGFTSDGTVTDACGISYTLQSKDTNEIYWFEPDHNGIVAGTGGGEWLIQASTLSDPITPTSIQAKRVTKYKCANIEPRRTGISLVFIQLFRRRVMEFLADVFTGRYVAPHLNEAAKHLTKDGVAEIAYQEELAPILWARTGNEASETDTTSVTTITSSVNWDPNYTSSLATLSNSNLTLDGRGSSTVVGIAVDLDAKKIWYFDPWYGGWNLGEITGENPATGAGGYTYTLTGDLFPTASLAEAGGVDHSITANFGGSAFLYPIPIGFSAWGAGTTWDPSNTYLPAVILSSGNLEATGTSPFVVIGLTGQRSTVATTSASTGKLYFEFTVNAVVPTSAPESDAIAVGLSKAGFDVTSHIGGSVNGAFSCGIYAGGFARSLNGDDFPSTLQYQYIINNSYPASDWRTALATLGKTSGKWYYEVSADIVVTPTQNRGSIAVGIADRNTLLSAPLPFSAGYGGYLGSSTHSIGWRDNGEVDFNAEIILNKSAMKFITGTTIGIAADIDAKLIWFYNPITGLWNGDTIANQNPGLGIGGLSFYSMSTPAYPAAMVANWQLATQITGNWGAIPFTHVIPNGFLPWGSAVETTVTTTSLMPHPGRLIGATYRRVSAFTTEAPAFVGWHRHDLGHGRLIISLSVTPTGNAGGTIDNLDMVTTDETNFYVEGLTQIFDEDDKLIDGWFVDGGLVPDSAYADTVSTIDGIRFTGLWLFIGETVAVVAFGLDLGEFQVGADGTIFVPYGSGIPPAQFDYTVPGAGAYLFTDGFIAENILSEVGRNGGVAYAGGFMPCCAGYTFTSQGQLLRPIAPEQAGSRSGPAFGHVRRSHYFVALLQNTLGLEVGTDFTDLNPALFDNDADVPNTPTDLYSGLWRNTVANDYGYDSMIAWQIVRPYPASIVSMGAFLKTSDA
jgi:hypothetical protein